MSNDGGSREDILELQRRARAADKVDRLRAEAFARMLAMEAWKVYVELLNSRLAQFSEELLAPARGLDGMISHEYLKGAMFGLVLARDLPAVIIAAMKDPENPDA